MFKKNKKIKKNIFGYFFNSFPNKTFKTKKAITPVVGIMILLSISVIGFVYFDNWYTSFKSSEFAKYSEATNPNSIEVLSVDESYMYVRNHNSFDVEYSSILINGTNCSLSGNFSGYGITKINISSCANGLSGPDKEIFINYLGGIVYDRVYIKKLDILSVVGSSLDCSTLNGGEWILVPGNAALGTSDFCVMKYEAKATTASEANLYIPSAMQCGEANSDGYGVLCPTDGSVNITSKAESKPITGLYQTQARELCKNLGSNYHLITDSEWITLARDIELVPFNWADGNVGSTIASGGGLKRGNVGVDDSASYNAASDPADRILDKNPKAMHTLSNGETIWDLSGNIWEYTNNTFDNIDSALGKSSEGVYEWTTISGYDYLESLTSSYDSSYGIGSVYARVGNAFPSGTSHAFVRGGIWYSPNEKGGIFALNLIFNPTTTGGADAIGFRCTYTE